MKTTKLEFINRTRKDEEEDDENGERKKRWISEYDSKKTSVFKHETFEKAENMKHPFLKTNWKREFNANYQRWNRFLGWWRSLNYKKQHLFFPLFGWWWYCCFFSSWTRNSFGPSVQTCAIFRPYPSCLGKYLPFLLNSVVMSSSSDWIDFLFLPPW